MSNLSTMKRVDLETFLEMPVGRFHWSLPLALWAWSPSLVGIAHIGAITSADLPLLRRGAELPFHRALSRPYRAVIDASRLTHLDPDVFAFLVEHLRAIRTEGAALVRTLCIVRPPGLHGAAALGLAHQYMDAIDTCFVDTLDDALTATASPSELAAMDELRQMFAAQSLLDRVRAELVESPNLSITTVASRLGASVRSLQRALALGGTTYRNEAARSRLLHARHLLATSDDGLDAIARSAGYGSAITLARRIREVYGTGPHNLRKPDRG